MQAEADSLLHALARIAALSADLGSDGPAGADGDPGSGFNPDYSASAGIPIDAGFTTRRQIVVRQLREMATSSRSSNDS